MQTMGLQALYARKKPNLSAPGHAIYPYLLKGIEVVRPNQVWAVDITYIRMRAGFLYLVAIMDWFSRYVLSWKLSNSMEVGFCIEALEDALKIATPEIHNSDQGSQFGSNEYTDILKAHGVAISMDGRGRAFDNIFIERLWRSTKYEEVYVHDYASGMEAHTGLKRYFTIYNNIRFHQALEYKTPYEIYFGKKSKIKLKIEPRLSRSPPWGDLETPDDRRSSRAQFSTLT
jgi:putative transposase